MQQQNTHEEPCQRTLSLGAGKAIGSEGECGWEQLGLSRQRLPRSAGQECGPSTASLRIFFFLREVGKNGFCFLMCRFLIFKHWQLIQMFFEVLCGPNKIYLQAKFDSQATGLQLVKFCVMAKAVASAWIQTPVLPSAGRVTLPL